MLRQAYLLSAPKSFIGFGCYVERKLNDNTVGLSGDRIKSILRIQMLKESSVLFLDFLSLTIAAFACVMTVSCGPLWPKSNKKAEINAFNSLWNPLRDIACRMQTLSHQFVSTKFIFKSNFTSAKCTGCTNRVRLLKKHQF